MNEEIPQLLKNLRLRKMAEIVEGELAAASKASPSYSELLARLLRAEWLDQQERRLRARIQAAHLPEAWTLESFPFKRQPASPAAKSCSWPNWSSSPRPSIWCSSAKRAWAKRD